jgi:hypothetical protein
MAQSVTEGTHQLLRVIKDRAGLITLHRPERYRYSLPLYAHGPREFGDGATNVDRSGSTPLVGANLVL